jgi:(E)-2-((N-methylformamido)methylene)succinate hydrolase
MMGKNHQGTYYQLYYKENAPIVVLIHGLGLTNEIWQWIIPVLSRNYTVLTYDLLGHGQSKDPQANPNLSDLSNQLLALMSHLKINLAGIIGFSLGGMIARKFAQDHREKVSALCLLNTPHRRTEKQKTNIQARVENAQKYGPASTVEAALERWFTQSFRLAEPQTMRLVRDWVMANKPEVYHQIYRILVDGVEEVVAPNPSLSCPTMIITADEDYGNGPEMAQEISNEIRRSKIIILKGLRHMALVESPNAVNGPILAFFQKVILKNS